MESRVYLAGELEGVFQPPVNFRGAAGPIAAEPGGSIIASYMREGAGTFDLRFIRFEQSGVIDSGFGDVGALDVALTMENGDPAQSAVIHAAAYEPQESAAIFFGEVRRNANADWFLIRVTTNGALDPLFGDNGLVVRSMGYDRDRAGTMALQSDGKIIVGGHPGFYAAKVLRFDRDGSLDSTFGDGGLVHLRFGAAAHTLVDLDLSSDDRIVMLVQTVGSSVAEQLIRLTTDGALDNSFNGNGSREVTGNGYQSLAIDSQDRIVASPYNQREQIAVRRFTAGGEVDLAFGEVGSVWIGLDDAATGARMPEVAVDPLDRIVLRVENYRNGEAWTNLRRLSSDGVEDAAFNVKDIRSLNYAWLAPDDQGEWLAASANGVLRFTGDESKTGVDFDYDAHSVTLAGTAKQDSLFVASYGDGIRIQRRRNHTRLPDPAVMGNFPMTFLIDARRGDDWINTTLLDSIPVQVRGSGGNDTILSGDGDDTLHGDEGDDRIVGNAGDDRLFGDGGSDRLYGFNGNDTLDGGSSRDRFYPGDGLDVCYGQSGDDLFYNSGGQADTLFGGSGNDGAQNDGSDTKSSVEQVIA